MALTEEKINIILEHPLVDALDQVREKLLDNNDDDSRQKGIAGLLAALVASPAAFNLPSHDGSHNVAVKLLSLLAQVRAGQAKADQFLPLIRHVVDKSSDIDIWQAVFNIIKTFGPLTPPQSVLPPTFTGTPIKASSSRLSDHETREVVERELFYEIRDCTFRNVGGFWDRFFDIKSWRKEQNAMFNGLLIAHDGRRWTDFPTIPDEKPVWDWIRSLQERFLDDAPFKFHTTNTAAEFKERKGQMDLFLQKPVTEPGNKLLYKNVLVVGEQKKSYDTGRFKADLLQLARYVRGVFADQPTRRFVHAFSLCASKMELWVFDRSGPYSSGTFDIHDEPDKFARAVVGYMTMDDDLMGLHTFIERQDGHRYVILDAESGEETRVRLDKAMVRQNAIVCRGTTCYKTQNGYVAKFAWASDKRKLEVELLKLAQEREVEGVATIVGHRRITSIAELRKGLQFSAAHRFRSEDVHFRDLPLATASMNTSSKRKLLSDHASDDTSGSKRRRSNSQKSKLVTELDDPQLTSKTTPSLYTPGDDLWENRIYSCLVISPAGRVISEFVTIKELLEAERDAIKAHRSLYIKGKILHHDISSNNIIITKPETAGGFNGMLIDLDLAKVRDSGPSGARHQTGTMQFMAVEVLRKTDHTYRHDLESFFYVLLWMCARQSWSNGFGGVQRPPKESFYRNWEVGSFQDIALSKAGHMSVDGLEVIMGEFPQALDIVKPLCFKVRDILFPLGKDGRMGFGTPAGDPDQLYGPIIAAYDEAISNL